MQNPNTTWALVTGASSGLGADFARQLASEGHNVVLVARREQALKDLAVELQSKHSVKVEILVADLGKRDAASRLLQSTQEAGWEVDILVNNAGFGCYGDFLKQTPEQVQSMIDLDVSTLVGLTYLYGQAMHKKGRGQILQVASVASFQAIPTYTVYAAAKAFVLSFGIGVNREWASSGVSCTTLCPGVTATEFFATSKQELSSYQRMAIMQSPDVVRIGLRAMHKRQACVVPGIMNKISVFVLRFVPLTWAAIVGQRLMK